MSKFRQLNAEFWASPQIELADVDQAKTQGFAMIVNNRPEGEAADQVPGSQIEAAARAAGLDYRAIPVTHAGFSEDQVRAMKSAIEEAEGPVLAYCRSGTRSTLLWALAQAAAGQDRETVAAQAAQAGYDVAPVRTLMDMLALSGAR